MTTFGYKFHLIFSLNLLLTFSGAFLLPLKRQNVQISIYFPLTYLRSKIGDINNLIQNSFNCVVLCCPYYCHKIMSYQRYLWCNCGVLLSARIRELSVVSYVVVSIFTQQHHTTTPSWDLNISEYGGEHVVGEFVATVKLVDIINHIMNICFSWV